MEPALPHCIASRRLTAHILGPSCPQTATEPTHLAHWYCRVTFFMGRRPTGALMVMAQCSLFIRMVLGLGPFTRLAPQQIQGFIISTTMVQILLPVYCWRAKSSMEPHCPEESLEEALFFRYLPSQSPNNPRLRLWKSGEWSCLRCNVKLQCRLHINGFLIPQT